MLEKINAAVTFIKSKVQSEPLYGIVLGTGLGGLVDEVKIQQTVDYKDIPYFPVSTVESHSGRLIFGELSGKNVVVMHGRFHYYEGYSMQEVTFPIRVMKLLGIQMLFVSNAAGGLNKKFKKSDLMIIHDHINLMPENPLTGKNWDEFGIRFPDMSEPYSFRLIKKAQSISLNGDIRLYEGVYAGVSGPNLETRAEYKFLHIIGADAVGMSTVPEIIVARQMDLECFAISVITDLCYPEAIQKISIEEVIASAKKAEPTMTKIFMELIGKL